MARRSEVASLEALEAAHSPEQPLAIPPGARVRVDFEAPVDPSTLINQSRYDSDLALLAAEESDANAIPLDPLTLFTNEWSAYAGYTLRVTRLADPATRRIPGQTYNRPCLEVESLGDTPFDPANLQATLQLINGGSGGVFRLWIIGDDGKPMPGAFLSRIAISDPPRQVNSPQAYQLPLPPPPAERQLSDVEKRFQAMQDRLLERAMARLMDPVESKYEPPQSPINDEDRLTLLLVREGGILPKVVSRLTDLVGAPETATGKETWSDWLKRTGGHLLETHPEIGERITGTLANVLTLIVNRLPIPQQIATAQQQSPLPPPVTHTAPQLARPNVTPTPSDYEAVEPSPDNQELELENATMIILEDLISLLSGTEPLHVDHPVFIRLHTEYPAYFGSAVAMIAQYPLEAIIVWIKSKSPLYASLFNSPITGPHYNQRLQELKELWQQAASKEKGKEVKSDTQEET